VRKEVLAGIARFFSCRVPNRSKSADRALCSEYCQSPAGFERIQLCQWRPGSLRVAIVAVCRVTFLREWKRRIIVDISEREPRRALCADVSLSG